MSAKFPSRNVAEALERSLKNADLKAAKPKVESKPEARKSDKVVQMEDFMKRFG